MSVTIGIDPHTSTHTAVAVDRDEQPIARFTFAARAGQTERLLARAEPLDADRVWAIESAAGLGRLRAQQLVAAGEPRPDRRHRPVPDTCPVRELQRHRTHRSVEREHEPAPVEPAREQGHPARSRRGLRSAPRNALTADGRYPVNRFEERMTTAAKRSSALSGVLQRCRSMLPSRR